MITIIISETKRSLEYINELIKNKINFKKIILYSKTKGSILKFIKKKGLSNFLIYLKTNNINSKILEKEFLQFKSKINIIATYPGEIVKNKLLLKHKLLHCHPGDLPEFKGSTTIYYSIILKKKICVTLFELNEEIDNGKILYKKNFNYPKNLNLIEEDFDNQIRAKTLICFLKSKKKFNYKKTKKKYIPYYIAHPMVRQIVLNKNYIKLSN
ncbi:formyltransferase family protein [Candidatus Pelagibacter sp. HIMB1623]|uniref:formyltransferase family protein n=1 Tax=Candidatus Pelagibacter sp. HIMB1623 TaxID=3413358 RepID=UPI003F86A678